MAAEVMAVRSCTLYDLEETFQAFAGAVALAEEPAVREAILDDIGQALKKAKEKRDAVVAFLRHCDQQQKFADAELDRIQRRKELIARVQQELELYVIHVIDQFASADRQGIKRLDGNLSSMRIQKNPDSVVITNDQALPVAWKDVIVTMPASVWEAMLQRLKKDDRVFFEQKLRKTEFKPDKRAIAAELKNGTEIPGADLKFGDLRLVIS